MKKIVWISLFSGLILSACGGGSPGPSKSERSGAVVTSDKVAPGECDHRILFVPQIHASIASGKVEVTQEWADQTLSSQFRIAQFLQKNSSTPVFSEQIDTDVTLQTASPQFKAMAQSARTDLFPQGLPGTLGAMTSEQKQFLMKAGGDAVSLILGTVPKLYRVVENKSVMDSLISRITTWIQQNPDVAEYPPQISNLIFQKRETLALEQIKRFFLRSPQTRDVILIFGEAHDFTRYPRLFPSKCVVRAEGF